MQAQLSMLAGPLPDVPIGPHCSEPYDCPFNARCWPVLPPHHVSTLYRAKRRARELEAQGYVTIHDLPDGLGLGVHAERQRRAVQAGRMIVEGDLRKALERIPAPARVSRLRDGAVGDSDLAWLPPVRSDSSPVQLPP